MIHTLEFYIKLTSKEVKDIISNYNIENDSFYDFETYITIRGIKMYLKKEYSKNFPQSRIEVFVDCLKLFDRSEITVDDADKIESTIKYIIYENLGLHKKLILSRIDYRYDAIVPSIEIRDKLFKLYKRLADKGNYMKKVLTFTHNNTTYNIDFGLRYANKSRVLNAYDKEKERISKHKDIEDYEVNVIRFEAQVKRAHIRYMKRDKKIEDNLKEYLTKDKYDEYMTKMVVAIIHFGDYYTFKRAETIINKSIYNSKYKEDIKNFLRIVAKKRSLQAAKDSIYYKKYKRILEQLEMLNINPVPIPKNDSPSYIANPIKNILLR